MTQELATIEEQTTIATFSDPEMRLERGTQASKVLITVIARKKKPVIINGEQYLEFEDWQTLGEFYGVSAKTGESELVDINGIKGAKAKGYLVDNTTGAVLGNGAEAYCMWDEERWVNKPWFQLASMAQTRAGAKALRNRLAWVAVLAGYRPTPAEEMIGNETPMASVEHWCSEHQVVFFKRGKMRSFAHPIGETGQWCHEGQQAPAEAPTPVPRVQVPAEPPEASSGAQVAAGGDNDAIPQFSNVGRLFTWAYKRWGNAAGEVCRALGASDPGAIEDLQEAAAKLKALWD